MCDKNIYEWVKLAVEGQDLLDYHIDVHGKSNKEDGYTGNLIFVSVTGNSKSGAEKTLDLVIKASKDSEKFRTQVPVKEAFEKEIFIYNEVKAAFDKFQRDTKISIPVEIMPYCYATHITSTNEVLILENLKSRGFDMWDRQIPLTFPYLKIVLEKYGKWHAMALALKKQRPEVYGQLTKNNVNMYTHFITKVKILDYFADIFEQTKNAVISRDEVEILEKLQFKKSDIVYILTDMFFEDPDYQVILHGDCWNNNFLFKSQTNATDPLDVRILDWQCSGLGSPVIDLSHLIYSCCDTGVYKDVKELLEIYHNSLSDCLKQFSCDPNEIFSFDKLVDHWRRFSSYGMVISNYIIKACLCKAEDTPDWAESAERGKGFLDNLNFSVENDELYFNRVRNNFLHYAHNLL